MEQNKADWAQAHVRAADVKARSAGRSQIGANSPETM